MKTSCNGLWTLFICRPLHCRPLRKNHLLPHSRGFLPMWFLVPNSCPSPKILSRSFLLQPPIVNSSPLLCLKSLFPLGRWVVLASARLVCTFGGWYWTRRYPPHTHTKRSRCLHFNSRDFIGIFCSSCVLSSCAARDMAPPIWVYHTCTYARYHNFSLSFPFLTYLLLLSSCPVALIPPLSLATCTCQEKTKRRNAEE